MFEQPPIELGERNLEFARVEIEPSLGTVNKVEQNYN